MHLGGIMTLGDLYFLLTVLIIFSSLIGIVVCLFQRTITRALVIGSFFLAWIFIYGIALVSVSLSATHPILPAGKEHCFDEMCFSVTQSRTVETLNGQQSHQGTFIIASIQLRNAARRTPQKPSSANVYLVDGTGHKWDISSVGQQAIGDKTKWDTQLLPGQSVTHQFVFDVPAPIHELYAVVTEGAGFPTVMIVGDENSWLHPQTRLSLYPD
jgi:Domain of unknown function (DUF4352)